METDVPAGPPGRPRPWLLVGLALAVGLAGAVQFWPTKPAVSAPASSNPRRPAVQAAEAIGPADLDVRLDALKTTGPDAAGTGRNPFRFQPKAPPPPKRFFTDSTGVVPLAVAAKIEAERILAANSHTACRMRQAEFQAQSCLQRILLAMTNSFQSMGITLSWNP